ncbi:uncharacterized protein LOC132935339 [Metopolophium dirhodum]|uniref:uncharacterized protein LOC132935339 n=1 Tax=Metopolophium dirhodum TaxID=44670 RepID=UPI00298FE43E|nr:uncharacterized protein LOC132935339 [Metopolophium dirhodum]
MWIVVLFEADSTLAAVPAFWYKDGLCAWPNSKISRNIEKRTAPNELEFSSYKAKILYEHVGSYLEARTLAQDNSEASSCDNLFEDMRLKKKKNSRFVSSKNQTRLLSPPLIDSEDSENDVDKNYKPFSNDDFTREISSSSSKNKKLKVFHKTGSFTTHDQSSTSKLSQHQTTPTYYVNHSPESRSYQSTPKAQLTEPFKNKDKRHQASNFEYDNDQGFKKFISRSMTNMKYEIESVNKRLDSFYSLLETINDKLNSNNAFSNLDNVFDNYENDIICIDNNDDLEKMEDKLTNDRQYKAYVIVLLTRLMGDSLSESVRKIMQKLFTDNFLANYSFIGFKGKKTFSNLQHCTVIIDAILKIEKI